jgi:hypothetical protein
VGNYLGKKIFMKKGKFIEYKTVFFQATYPTVQYGNMRLGGELTFGGGATIDEVFDKAKEDADRNFKRLWNPQAVPFTDFNTGAEYTMRRVANTPQEQADADKEFEDFKKLIDMAQTEDAAITLLSNSSYKYSIEAKKYIAHKFKENGKSK